MPLKFVRMPWTGTNEQSNAPNDPSSRMPDGLPEAVSNRVRRCFDWFKRVFYIKYSNTSNMSWYYDFNVHGRKIVTSFLVSQGVDPDDQEKVLAFVAQLYLTSLRRVLLRNQSVTPEELRAVESNPLRACMLLLDKFDALTK
jgi:hypothetical protein